MGKYIQRVTAASGRRRASGFLGASATSSPVSERDASGRFQKAAQPVPAVVVVMTRQQRRHAERQAAKLGRSLEAVVQEAWDEVEAAGAQEGGGHD